MSAERILLRRCCECDAELGSVKCGEFSDSVSVSQKTLLPMDAK